MEPNLTLPYLQQLAQEIISLHIIPQLNKFAVKGIFYTDELNWKTWPPTEIPDECDNWYSWTRDPSAQKSNMLTTPQVCLWCSLLFVCDFMTELQNFIRHNHVILFHVLNFQANNSREDN